ncbi:vitamin B12 ABC transporter ATP-binding protein BtuD [Chimaeribacter californicus]|uniref:Vitamin B12 import ATP-binding protein BtuD n=1 Tax=Chimaeribacter californicus TaxID=2060067 RepID=A0A2N5EG94_9GAMM|nr:vitamin B12 ABC transporter ATP-binding protein BtuD [Chimaeribacter californicus]PLR41566.1 vitamin B12 ABC transporter ATP-binding protein BtuD [Chimaeribacter californicus]
MLELRQFAVAGRLAPFSAEVAAGCQVHLIGPNGAGKSSLLAALAGVAASGGEARLGGEPLLTPHGPQQAGRRAYLSQQQPPVSMMPVFQYLALHQPPGSAPQAVERVIAYLAAQLRMADKLARPTTALSGGEWQRVRLMAVLLQIWPTLNPHGRLLLLDEPVNSLDVAQKAALDQLIAEVCGHGLCVILSAHDLNHTLHQADTVWLLHQGRLAAAGSPDAVMQPALLDPVYGVTFQRHAAADRQWLITRTA